MGIGIALSAAVSTHRKPILLIDDQKFVGVVVGRFLAAEPDLELHHCEIGAAALATAQRLGPALILQDLLLPDADGLSLVRQYRDDSLTAHTPIVVLSGNDDDESRAAAMAAGASDYLVKLPTREALVACVRRHLERASRAA